MSKICSIDSCRNPHRARGLCISHYMRLRKHGNPIKITRKPPNTATQEDIKKSKLVSYQRNKEKYRENRRAQNKKFYDQKKEEILAKKRAWRAANRDKVQAQTAKGRASKLLATPSWLTKSQLIEIRYFYTKASELTAITGIKHHVDHIIPFRGKFVCGLHVPWNLQVVTAHENLSKGNRC